MPTTTKKLAYYYKDGQYYEVTADIPAITVDAALSTTSENPVQNKVVNAAITAANTKAGKVVISGTEYTATFDATTGVLTIN